MNFQLETLDIKKIITFLEALQPTIQKEMTSVNVTKKGDASPVTNLDIYLNKHILKFLTENYPNDGIVSEEEDSRITGKRTWIVDPVDGTKDLINKTGQWSIMIGCTVGHKPIFGFVYQPELNILYFGSPATGSFIKSKDSLKRIFSSKKYKSQHVTVVDSHNHPEPLRDEISTAFKKSKLYEYGSLGLKLCHIADGTADFYLNTSGKCKIWDICAGDAILRGAGGGVRDKNGLLKYDPKIPAVKFSFVGSSLRFAKNNKSKLKDFLF